MAADEVFPRAWGGERWKCCVLRYVHQATLSPTSPTAKCSSDENPSIVDFSEGSGSGSSNRSHGSVAVGIAVFSDSDNGSGNRRFLS